MPSMPTAILTALAFSSAAMGGRAMPWSMEGRQTPSASSSAPLNDTIESGQVLYIHYIHTLLLTIRVLSFIFSPSHSRRSRLLSAPPSTPCVAFFVVLFHSLTRVGISLEAFPI